MEKETYGWILIGIILLILGSGVLMGRGYMGFSMGLGFLLMVMFWIAVIWLVFNLLGNEVKEDPIEILKQRYAKGEISKKQFEQMKKGLV